MEIVQIPIKEIFSDSEFNCRGHIIPFDVMELANSIRANGLQQPVVVEPYNQGVYKYRIVMGHRRTMACHMVPLETVPCIVKKDLSRIQALTMNLVENLDRKDLTVMQEARAISKFVTLNMTIREIAK